MSKYNLPKYSRLTKKSILDIDYNKEDYEKEIEELIADQDKQLKVFGYENNDEDMHLIHFFNSAFFDEKTREMTIYDAIQCLAIKDGYDLVAYENGNKGYIAYYNTHKNGFEILI